MTSCDVLLAVGELAQSAEKGEGFRDLPDGVDSVAQGHGVEGRVLDQRGPTGAGSGVVDDLVPCDGPGVGSGVLRY
ncbi:hypothetical protein ACH4KT_31790 [Streptomyces anulatus]